jgi:alpha-tubulin suppressor-like RCC1 family protein
MIEPRSRRASAFVLAVCLLVLASCSDTTGPDDAPDPGLAVAVVAGSRYTLALAVDGTSYCWGLNDSGSCGAGTWESPLVRPTKVTGGLTFEWLSAGLRHSCGLTSEGQAYCWGYSGYGELGSGQGPRGTREPVPVAQGALRFSSIVVGGAHTCGLTRDGALYCWGSNGYGTVGDGSGEDRLAPVAVAPQERFEVLESSGSHVCALTRQGAAFCWGRNDSGLLGDGTTADRATPVPSLHGMRVTSLSFGEQHACAVSQEGSVYCWGGNDHGQLGAGSGDLGWNVPVLVRW